MHATRFARGGRWRVVGPKSARSRIGAANPGLREIPKSRRAPGGRRLFHGDRTGGLRRLCCWGFPLFGYRPKRGPIIGACFRAPGQQRFLNATPQVAPLVDTFGPSRESRDIYPARILSPAPARQDLNPLHEPNHHPALGCSVVAHSSSWPNLFLHDETGDYGWTVNRASTDLPAPRCVSTNACTPSVRAR